MLKTHISSTFCVIQVAKTCGDGWLVERKETACAKSDGDGWLVERKETVLRVMVMVGW